MHCLVCLACAHAFINLTLVWKHLHVSSSLHGKWMQTVGAAIKQALASPWAVIVSSVHLGRFVFLYIDQCWNAKQVTH